MKSEYFLPSIYLENLKGISGNSFEEIYGKYKTLFFDSKPIPNNFFKQSNLSRESTFIITRGNLVDLINTPLENSNLEYIGPLDYIFTIPVWDWWIEPLFKRQDYRGKNLNLAICTNNTNSYPENELKSRNHDILEVLDFSKLDNPKLVNASRIKNVLLEIYPRKLACDLKRIRKVIYSEEFDKIYFVLRGGRFIHEMLPSLPKKEMVCIDSNNFIESDKGGKILVIDDCLGSARTLNKLIKCLERPFSFASLDITLPAKVYQQAFKEIQFFLPSARLNIYSCRLFEDNPLIVGEGKTSNSKDNLIKKNLMNRVSKFMDFDTEKLFKEVDNLLEGIKTFD